MGTDHLEENCGLQKTKLYYETETRDTGLCFGLAEDTTGLFPQQDRGGTQGQLST